MKFRVVCLLAILLVIALPSGVFAEGKTLVFASFANWIHMGTTEQLVEEYNKMSGNTIELQGIEESSWPSVLMTKITTGDWPDIVGIWTGTTTDMYGFDKIAVDLSKEPWVSRVSPSTVPFMKKNGKWVGFPYEGGQVMGVVYNKKIFADLGLSIPKTYAEFDAVCEKVKKSGITPIYVAGKDSWPVVQCLNSAWGNMWGGQADLLDKLNANKMKWGQIPQFTMLVKKLSEWGAKGYYNADLASATYEASHQVFGTGKAAMMFQGEWVSGEFLKKYPDCTYGMFAHPVMNKGDTQFASLAGSQALYVNAKSKNIDVAKDFLNFLARKENLDDWYAAQQGIPPFLGMKLNLDQCGLDMLPLLNEGKGRGHWGQFYVVPYSSDMNPILMQAMLRTKSPEAVVKDWDDYMARIGKQMKLPGF